MLVVEDDPGIATQLVRGLVRGGYAAGQVTDWIRAGGTAVVFGGKHTEWKRLGLSLGTAAGGGQSVGAGGYARAPRDIPIAKLDGLQAAPQDAAAHLPAPGAALPERKKVREGRRRCPPRSRRR